MNQENGRYVLEFGYVSGEGMGGEAICLPSKLLDLYKMGNEKSILVKISTRKWWTRTLLTMNQIGCADMDLQYILAGSPDTYKDLRRNKAEQAVHFFKGIQKC